MYLGFTPFSPKITGDEKFGVPSKRTRPRNNEAEEKAWDTFKGCVEAEIQIIINVCQRKQIIEIKIRRIYTILLVLTNIRQSQYSLDLFWSDLDTATVQSFINKHCVLCDGYFSSDHDLSVYTKYSTDILSGLDLTKMSTDF